MAITLNNCTMHNNTTVVIRVVPNAPAAAFDIPAGGQMPSGNIVFDTIQVSGNVLDTNATTTASSVHCYFNTAGTNYVMTIPDTFSATFS